MMRWFFLILGVVGLGLMFFPVWATSATEIGFAPGDPDPNTYQESVLLGFPWDWVERGISRNEINNPQENSIFRFHPGSFLGYAAIAVSGFMGFALLRKTSR